MLPNKEDYFINLLASIIGSLEKIEEILQEVSETGKTYINSSIIEVFEQLFKDERYAEHFEYKITLIGKSTQAIYWGNRTIDNSNRHLTLNLKSEYIIFYNQLYDDKIADLLKFLRHVFSLIENFSVYQNKDKVKKYNTLITIIKKDFIYWKSVQTKSLERATVQTDILNAFKFLSFTSFKKNNWQEYLKVIIESNISYLYHFTDRSNIASIQYNRGLYSWMYCENNGIRINRPGSNLMSRDLDKSKNLENFVRLSFCENHPMKFIAKKEGRISDPVTLKCDTEIILHKSTLFSNCNATKTEAIIDDSLELFASLRFDLFHKQYYDIQHDSTLKSLYQAEILVAESLPIEYVLNIDDL